VGSAAVLIDCTFQDNSAFGGGGWPANGGAVFESEGSPMFVGCTFRGNWAKDSGGALHAEQLSGATLIGCVLVDNAVDFSGGAMYNGFASEPTLQNCTFTYNNAGVLCGGVYSDVGSAPTLTNCLLWGNSGPPSFVNGPAEYDQIDGGSPVVSYSCIQGLDSLAGNGNLGDNPLLEPDLIHIRRRSPCRNAGDPAFVPSTGQTDIDGDQRVMDGRVDVGADEVRLGLGTPGSAEPL
jgi:predicted outer membrane repeat protein